MAFTGFVTGQIVPNALICLKEIFRITIWAQSQYVNYCQGIIGLRHQSLIVKLPLLIKRQSIN
jgi:hypothetical protein